MSVNYITAGTIYDPATQRYTVGALNPGQSATVTLLVRVNAAGTFGVSGTVAGNVQETNLANNAASVLLSASASVSPALTKQRFLRLGVRAVICPARGLLPSPRLAFLASRGALPAWGFRRRTGG